MRKSLLIHYGELSTKGKNRENFVESLAKNIRHALKGRSFSLERDYDHIRIYGDELEELLPLLLDVSGINRISLAYECGLDMDEMEETALFAYKESGGTSFKVETSRPNKAFPLQSYDISKTIGGYVLSHAEGSKVDVHSPDVRIRTIVSRKRCDIYAKTFAGAGGYPLGSLGKAMMMLSGGIDSPVAAYLLLRRGIALECVHFAAPPYTSVEAVEKVMDLLKVLNRFEAKIRLHIVPFTALQLKIYEAAGDSYAITIMRRMMTRIAVGLARRQGCLAIATGESIGQVASQTLQSLNVINDVTSFPIIRPLAAYDKTATIEIAKKIGTYDISIRPHEDCCTIFTPRHPVTRPKMDDVLKIEKSFDYQSLVDECIEKAELRLIGGED